MKNLTMIEFINLCKSIKNAEYIYNTNNQNNNYYTDIKAIIKYTTVVSMLNPNKICFINSYGTMCLSRIINIKYKYNPAIGYIFNITCGDSNSSSTYTILVDEKIF